MTGTHTIMIVDLREKFFKKFEDEGPPDPRGFHPADIARIKNNNDWLRRFLEHNDFNLETALNMLWEVCNWRSKFGTNDISEDNIRRDFLEDGVIFSYGNDKEGNALFIIKSKLHTKGAKDFGELQRCIVYWFERLEREGNGNQISLFFDMSESGISNMDMELIKYLIGLFESYYPYFLNYIIIFEMPWVLNTAFKLIKSWLPEKAIPKIKFTNKSTLKEYVDVNIALKCWGGNSDYTFKFVPEVQTSADTAMNGKLDNKKVHFAENSPMVEQPPCGFGDQVTEEQCKLLEVEPDVITFNEEGSEMIGRIAIKNITSDIPVSFKIKTTTPEKFRVRPSSGVLSPSEQRIIIVVLLPGYNMPGLLDNIRFLVTCLPLKSINITSQELAAIWKSGKPAEQHRLRCRRSGNEDSEVQKTRPILSSSSSEMNRNVDRTVDTLLSRMIRIEEHCTKLRNEATSLKYLLFLSITLTILMAIITIYILRNDLQNSSDLQNCHIHRDI